jgi:dTDP-4-amino-4,6-dideoxygalactose transaminase
VFSSLPDGVCPLGFPVKCTERNKLKERLISQQIYPPIHWTLPQHITEHFPELQKLSSSILTIPCDQRYGLSDMKRIADILNSF